MVKEVLGIVFLAAHRRAPQSRMMQPFSVFCAISPFSGSSHPTYNLLPFGKGKFCGLRFSDIKGLNDSQSSAMCSS
jgi:hypothetical protein